MEDKKFELKMENHNKFPKFLISDNFDDNSNNVASIYIIHTQYPTFILDNNTLEIKYLQLITDEEKESAENKKLIENALAWTDYEFDKYAEIS